MFYYSLWQALPLHQRNAIAHQFGIPKTGPTHVDNNTIKSDGYEIAAIEHGLNLDVLQQFLETEETEHAVLWQLMLTKLFPETYPEGTVSESDALEVLETVREAIETTDLSVEAEPAPTMATEVAEDEPVIEIAPQDAQDIAEAARVSEELEVPAEEPVAPKKPGRKPKTMGNDTDAKE